LHFLTHITDSDNNRRNVDPEGFEHEISLRIDLNVGIGKSGLLGNDVHAAFALLFLKAQRNATNGATGNALHRVSYITRNLVAQTLRGDDSDFVAKFLVHVEIVAELPIPLLDD
jgi:hypothetical protein